MNRSGLWIRLLLGALAAAGVLWLLLNTEWVDVPVPARPTGEAARKPHYAAMRLVRGLGGRVAEPLGLERLPPSGATLVLATPHWTLFPERAPSLRHWVEQGGHLVVPPAMLADDALARWVPVSHAKPRKPEVPAAGKPCRPHREPDDVPATFDRRELVVCGFVRPTFDSRVAPAWALDSDAGRHALRVPVGLGSVTVLDLWGQVYFRQLVIGDNALVFAAALRLSPASEVWFGADEARAPLLAWLWDHAAVAVLLALLALATALWRSGTRFGPRLAPDPPGRRSIAEQVRGTAEFVWQRGAAALLAAQRRALDEAAARRLPGWRALDASARAQAVARAAALDAADIAAALDPASVPSPKALPALLARLEAARRRIAARASLHASVR